MKVSLNCITQPLITTTECDHNGTQERYLNPEEYIIYEARISSDDRLNNETAPKLLRYLIDKKHWSPFEMISIGIEVQTSRAIAQQILRHRSFSFQEFSQRYAEVTAMEPIQLRYQATKNRQSSTTKITDPSIEGKALDAIQYCENVYHDLVENNVAKECARMVLPLTSQTTLCIHGTLRSWIHFFEQRCSPHAQLEIQEIAYEARRLISEKCPWVAKALNWTNYPKAPLPVSENGTPLNEIKYVTMENPPTVYIDKNHGKCHVLFPRPDDGACLIIEILDEDEDPTGIYISTEADCLTEFKPT